MNEDIRRILKMVEDGKINSDQATELISALNNSDVTPAENKAWSKHLRVNVKSSEGKNINIKLPLKFVKGILKATGKLPMKIEGGEEIDMQVITDAIEHEISGKIVEVHTDKGDYVEVVIE